MIEVRVFSSLRKGRDKITMLPAEDFTKVADILRHMDISTQEVAILLINGFHSKPEDTVKDGDIVALFPAVGGG